MRTFLFFFCTLNDYVITNKKLIIKLNDGRMLQIMEEVWLKSVTLIFLFVKVLKLLQILDFKARCFVRDTFATFIRNMGFLYT